MPSEKRCRSVLPIQAKLWYASEFSVAQSTTETRCNSEESLWQEKSRDFYDVHCRFYNCRELNEKFHNKFLELEVIN